MAAAGGPHSVLLRDDGQAVAFGRNFDQQCNIPALPAGVSYVACAAGSEHSVLIRGDGQAVAFGATRNQRCNIPALPAGVRYVACAAGYCHSVLLRNDGQAVAFGWNAYQQCNIPALPVGSRYWDPLARLDPRVVRSLLLGAVRGGSLARLADRKELARVVSFLTRRVVVDY